MEGIILARSNKRKITLNDQVALRHPVGEGNFPLPHRYVMSLDGKPYEIWKESFFKYWNKQEVSKEKNISIEEKNIIVEAEDEETNLQDEQIVTSIKEVIDKTNKELWEYNRDIARTIDKRSNAY